MLQELRQEGFGWAHPVKPVHDKQTRMVNQTAIIEAGWVHIPKDAPWLAEYLHELAVFPNGKFADQVELDLTGSRRVQGPGAGRGLLEFIRQENEAKRAHGEEILVVRGPPGMSGYGDIDGKQHPPQPDGCFYLTRLQAGQIMNYPGWSVVRTLPAGAPF